MTTITTRTRTARVRDAAPAAARVGTRTRPVVSISPRRLERLGGFLLPLALYLWVGARMALTLKGLPGDALSRTEAASSALFSRDPHLEAIGFVWGPFPTLWQVPLVWLARWWRPLVTEGMAGVIVSSVLMATMVATVRKWLQEAGVAVGARLAVVALLAVQPFVVLYGANGMSEAGLLCFGVIAAHRLARWWETEHPSDLVTCGTALAFAYLTRYEAAASAVVVVAIVAVRAYRRSPLRGRDRSRSALLRAVVVGGPPAFAMVLWALASWAIVGQPFAQFTSRYGNSALVRSSSAGIAASIGSATAGGRIAYFARQLGAFGWVTLVVGGLLVWFGSRAGARTAAALTVMVPALLFNLVGAADGSTYAWARYVIVAVPLGVLLLGPLLASVRSDSRSPVLAALAPVVAVALLVGSAATGVSLMRQGALESGDEAAELAAVPGYAGAHPPTGVSAGQMAEGRAIAAAIDRLHPGPGSVLTDVAVTFPVVMAAADQRTYVIPSDRDYLQILAAPVDSPVRYLLVSAPGGSQDDSVADALPGLFGNGAGIARRVAEWGGTGSWLHLRLYRIDHRSAR